MKPTVRGCQVESEESLHEPVEHSDRELDGLPGDGPWHVELDSKNRDPVVLTDTGVERLVVHVLVADQQLQGASDIGFLADDQAQRPQVREPTKLCQS